MQNNKNLKGGTLWDIKIFSRKKSHSAEKNPKGDSLVPSGFVGYLEKVTNDSGVCLGPLAGLGALGDFRIVSENWTDQCEDCSLKKKQDENV